MPRPLRRRGVICKRCIAFVLMLWCTGIFSIGLAEENSEILEFLPSILSAVKNRDSDGDGYSRRQGDCADNVPAIHPGATEICGDGVDQNCDGHDLECEPENYSLEELTPYSEGTCPTLVAGHQVFFSDGLARDVRIDLPDNPLGAPVLFAWHWYRGDADQMMAYSNFQTWPADHGVIVVAPESRKLFIEWDSWAPPNNPDTILFDDLTRCLAEQFHIDLERIYSSGFSAGAMWTVSLTYHRSTILAASAPLSGHSTVSVWDPAAKPPMLLTWGGPTDTYAQFNFENGSLDQSSKLSSVGQFHVVCVHDRGHSLPTTGTDYVWQFFEAHPRGIATPWAQGLPASMPAMCSLP